MDDDSLDDGINLSYCPITTTLFRPNMSTQGIVQQTSETTSPLSGETYFSLHLIAKNYKPQQPISNISIFIVIFICHSLGVELKVNFKFFDVFDTKILPQIHSRRCLQGAHYSCLSSWV